MAKSLEEKKRPRPLGTIYEYAPGHGGYLDPVGEIRCGLCQLLMGKGARVHRAESLYQRWLCPGCDAVVEIALLPIQDGENERVIPND